MGMGLRSVKVAASLSVRGGPLAASGFGGCELDAGRALSIEPLSNPETAAGAAAALAGFALPAG